MFFSLLLAITHIEADDGDSYGCWSHLIHSVTPSAYTKEMLNECLLDEEKGYQCVLTSRLAFALGLKNFLA